jgi:hypothetical protein
MNLSARVGFHPAELALLRRMPQFRREARLYEQAQGDRFRLDRSLMQPVLGDYRAQAGNARGQYFHQDLWAARRIYAARPPMHVDVGSRIDGFVAHVLTFMPVTVVDIRPLESDVEGLTFRQGDMCRLEGFATGSVPSVSSLHAVEHVGLGRYGDPIDPEGCFTALRELSRIVQPGGKLYIGLPVGRERLIFNSERIFDPRTIVRTLSDMRLDAFDAVDDAERFVPHADLDAFARAEYSCGLFQFAKV